MTPKSYITLQVIYPDTQQQMATKGWTDDDLLRVMDIVTLSHMIAREGGWDSKADWKVKSKQFIIYFFMNTSILSYPS